MLSWLKGDKVDHPLADAKAAKKIVEDFPYKDSWKTLEDANYWLGSVNETAGFKIERRFEIIDLLDQATRKAQDRLLETYLTLPENDRVQEKRIWKTVADYWKLLGDGYLLCVDQARELKNVPNKFKPQLPMLAARTTRALRLQMKWVLMRYGVVRSSLWGEFSRCTLLAEAAGMVEKLIEMYPGVKEPSSQSYELLRAMMLWAASPNGLSPVEQDIADRLVVKLTPQFRIDSKPWEGCDYYFDLAALRPPLRLTRSTPVSEVTRYFDAGEAREAVQIMLSQVSRTGNIPSGLSLGSVADGPTAARVLKHLGVNWAKEMPERAFERCRTALILQVVHGYQNILGIIEPDFREAAEPVDPAAQDSWVAEDASTGGYGLVVPAGKGEWLRVGALVALHSEMEAAWQLGVIRRVKSDEYRQYRIGVQLISKLPVPVHLRSLSGVKNASKPQHAILLSARASPNGGMHVVARRDMFAGQEPIEAMFGKPAATCVMQPGGMVESGYDFDWLRYKLSESIA